jgi:LmbE family N-acetylglucosaminyl deacetylase
MPIPKAVPAANPVAAAGDPAEPPKPVRRHLGWWWRMRHRIRSWRGSSPIGDNWVPAGGPVMVIAPHPDDEVIGCGGTIRRHVLAGDAVSILYLTCGEHSCGYPWLDVEEKRQERTAEARKSCAVLGVADYVFLEGSDGQCHLPQETILLTQRLLAAINQRRPKVIYVPHADDNHIDHIAAFRILTRIARQFDWRPLVYQYELWSPLTADFAVDITPHMRTKLKAIKCHRLALDAFNYLPTAMGLAAYRSGTMLERKGYAEAFKRTDLASL